MSDENKSLIQRLKHSARYEASNLTADPAQPNQSDATAPLEPEKRLGLLWTGNDGWLMTDGSLSAASERYGEGGPDWYSGCKTSSDQTR